MHEHHGRRWAGLFAALLIALLVGLGTAPAAQAHNVLVSSSPEDGSTPAQAPDQIELTFNATVGSGGNGITVTGPDGQKYEEGEVHVDGEKASIALRTPQQAGEFLVNYRIISADGHPIEGEIAYTLTPDAVPAADPTPDAPSSSPDQGGAVGGSDAGEPAAQPTNPLAATGPVAAVVAGIAVVALVVVLLIRIRRPGGPGRGPGGQDGEGRGER
ncbi:hypothetical protein DEF23_18115 [Marinitenerispora sediminis]|uniref:CopC domain-containing protein n=1 Tax=Marinitenerispora sediminis TaxID=1931232 RepID=A0A368T3K3_9ACTN|nr:hypothetical protein DEF28_20255 [Marinitenerispora sediminis]RCV53127.1 hypothetical protein DEF23_18115 [Marinitenerispora sediminis]RCV57172.1 hypothetical protein DEF24_15605 [Marinitenerispora sediminis]